MKKYLSRLLAAALALVLLVVPASALTVDQALELLEELYYYEIPDEAYQAETLDELMSLLEDPYTQYMTAEEYQAFLKLLEGDSNVIGIGVSCRYTPEGILILSTISGGSAREAGLQAGDLIVEIDGQSCVPANEENAGRLTGPEGTQVSVTVLRDGERKGYTLTRRPVVEPNVELSIEGRVGLLDCNSFGKDTGKEFAKLVKDNDGRVDVWVVDLRGNEGGNLAAVYPLPENVASLRTDHTYVLIDGGVASASMTLLGFFKNELDAVLVGEPTAQFSSFFHLSSSLNPPLVLPHSQMRINLSDAWWNWDTFKQDDYQDVIDPAWGWDDWEPITEEHYDEDGRLYEWEYGVLPDVYVHQDIEDIRQGKDSVLEWVLAQ